MDNRARRGWIQAAGVACALTLGAIVIACGGDQAGAGSGGGTIDPSREARTLGDPTAPVTIEEWGDFQ